MGSDAQEFIRWAERRGWTASVRRNGHLRFSRQGCGPVFVASTPSDHRALKNMRSLMIRKEQKANPMKDGGTR